MPRYRAPITSEMTGLIFAKTMSPTTIATVIAVFSSSSVVSLMSVRLRTARAGGAAGLDRRPDGAPAGDLLLGWGALDRVPGGDLLEVGVADGWVPLGHGDLQWAGGRSIPEAVDCQQSTGD